MNQEVKWRLTLTVPYFTVRIPIRTSSNPIFTVSFPKLEKLSTDHFTVSFPDHFLVERGMQCH